MVIKKIFITFIMTIFTVTYAKTNNDLFAKNSLVFDGKTYTLKWSSHPKKHFFKQEYLPNNEKLDKYKTMIVIDFYEGDFQPQELVDTLIQNLTKRKKTDPVANFNIFTKDKEYIVDFLLSESSKNYITLLERNVYRYKIINDTKSQRKGVLIFGVSERAYDSEVDVYFENLKQNKNKLIINVGNYDFPKLKK